MRKVLFVVGYFSKGLIGLIPIFFFHTLSFSQIFSDTINIESVTVYHNQPIHGTIAGAKIITVDSIAIANKANQNLADLLLENTPLFIKTYGRGSMASVSMRGTGTSHTKVYWNGININSPMTGSVDFSLIPVYFIDDINLHYGQSSLVFGSGGLGGAINLESNAVWTDQFGVKLYQSVGSFNTYSTALKANYGVPYKIQFQTRAFYESSDNNFRYQNTADISKTNPFQRLKNADYEKSGLFQEIYYKSRSNMIKADLWVSDISRSIPKLMSNYSVDEKNRQTDYVIRGIVKWRHFSDKSNLELASGYYTQTIDYFLIKYPTHTDPETILDNNSFSSTFFSKLDYSSKVNNWMRFSAGSKLSNDWVKTLDKKTSLGYSHDRISCDLFSSVELYPLNQVKLNLLFRKEYYSKNQSPLLPSISIEYKPFDINLSLKSSIAKNYNIPSLNDLYWKPGGNPWLKPELSYNLESGLSFEWSFLNIMNNIEVTYFNSKIENWIIWLPSFKGSWEPNNIKLVNNKGLEILIRNIFQLNNVKFIESASYSYSKTTNNGKQLPFIPLHSAVASSTLQFKRFHITHNFSYYSERYTTTSNNPNQIKSIYPFFMNGLSIGYTQKAWKSTLLLLIRVDNLLDENYQSILWRPMPGRNYSLTLRLDI